MLVLALGFDASGPGIMSAASAKKASPTFWRQSEHGKSKMCRNRVSAAIGSSKLKRRLKHDRRSEHAPQADSPLRRKIEAKLCQMRWSPEQISGWLFEQGTKLSHERIYQMIWQDKRDGGDLWRSLRRRGKRYNKRGGKNAGRGLIPDIIDISERPTIVARKARLGDWEGDTVVSAGHKGGLLSGTSQSDILPMAWVGASNAKWGSSTMTVDRRRILQIALGGGSLSPLVLPERWVNPVVKSVIVPAHAAASPATTTTTTTTPRPTTSPS